MSLQYIDTLMGFLLFIQVYILENKTCIRIQSANTWKSKCFLYHLNREIEESRIKRFKVNFIQ